MKMGLTIEQLRQSGKSEKVFTASQIHAACCADPGPRIKGDLALEAAYYIAQCEIMIALGLGKPEDWYL